MNPLFSTNQNASNYLNSLTKTKKASPFSSVPQKTASVTPAAPNATSPAVKPLTPANPTSNVTSPVAQNYVSSISSNNNQTSSNEPYLKYITGIDSGLTEDQVRSNYNAYNKANSSQTSSTPTKTPVQTYLESLKQANTPSEDELALRTKLADINSNIFGTKFEGEQKAIDLADTPGMLKGGAQEASSRSALRSNQELARLAVQQNAAANSLEALTGNRTAQQEAIKPVQIGNDFYDPATGEKLYTDTTKDTGFTLSPGEVRYDAKGNKIASGGEKPMTATQEAAQIAATEKEKAAQQSASQAIGTINGLLNSDRYKAISGATQTGSIPFLGDRAAVGEYDQLQGLLKLGVRSLIKGQGSVSDYEGKILGQAASSLSRLTSEEQFKEALQKVRGVLKTNNGQVTTVEVTNPETGETITTDLSGDEIYHLVSEGNTVKYK